MAHLPPWTEHEFRRYLTCGIDEWLAANVNRANRGALAVVLLAQCHLAVPLGYMANLVPPRGPIVMAMATVMIGLVSRIGLFLWYDREAA